MIKISKGLLSSSSMLFLALIACFSSSTASSTNIPNDSTENPASSSELVLSSPTPQYQNMPNELPAEHEGHAGDYDSSLTADEKRASGGDRFTFGRFERPFNANTMDVYYPYLDILDTLIYQDETWIYAVITLKGRDASQKLPGTYGVELDVDLDGGGDWWLLADQPSTGEWSTQGVQVLFDTNNDVGGSLTVNADTSGGNGYETIVFDQGVGNDPELAWARISPQDPNAIEIAAKRFMLEGDTSYLAGMWAGTADLDPALFDLNDHQTHEQAGTALIELEYFYPIKELSEIDNSCRMAIGFAATGNEPGLCPVAQQENASCPAERVYCVNFGNQTVCYCLDP